MEGLMRDIQMYRWDADEAELEGVMWSERLKGEIKVSEREQYGGLQKRTDSKERQEKECAVHLFFADTDQIS